MNVFQEMVMCRMFDLESMNVACRIRRDKKRKHHKKYEDNV